MVDLENEPAYDYCATAICTRNTTRGTAEPPSRFPAVEKSKCCDLGGTVKSMKKL